MYIWKNKQISHHYERGLLLWFNFLILVYFQQVLDFKSELLLTKISQLAIKVAMQ